MPRSRTTLPEILRPFFWDYPPGSLAWKRDQGLIVERVLTRGTWPAQRWLWERLGDDGLRAWLIASRGRSLTPRQLRFWQLLLDVPSDLVDDWIEAKKRSVWFRRIACEASS